MNENPVGVYALYEFLKELVDKGDLKEKNDNSELYFQTEDGIMHPVTDYSFVDNKELIMWE